MLHRLRITVQLQQGKNKIIQRELLCSGHTTKWTRFYCSGTFQCKPSCPRPSISGGSGSGGSTRILQLVRFFPSFKAFMCPTEKVPFPRRFRQLNLLLTACLQLQSSTGLKVKAWSQGRGSLPEEPVKDWSLFSLSFCSKFFTFSSSFNLSDSSDLTTDCRVFAEAFSPRSTVICRNNWRMLRPSRKTLEHQGNTLSSKG